MSKETTKRNKYLSTWVAKTELSLTKFAEEAGISHVTLRKALAGNAPDNSTRGKILNTLERLLNQSFTLEDLGF